MNEPRHQPRRPAALDGVRLSGADLEALARNGYVAPEFRGQRGPYFKLRFRRDKRQHVRYLGRDAAHAEQVRAALRELQQPRRDARGLARALAEARRRLRALKDMLAPRGGDALHFHGYALRRRRQAPQAGGPAAAS